MLLVQFIARRKANLQQARPCLIGEVLVEFPSKVKRLKACGQFNGLQRLVEVMSKRQCLEATRQCHLVHGLIELTAKRQCQKALGKFTFSIL